MSAVSLPISIEALTSPAAVPVTPAADPSGDFSELLSTLAAALGVATPAAQPAGVPPAVEGSAPPMPSTLDMPADLHAAVDEAPGTDEPPEMDGEATATKTPEARLVSLPELLAALQSASETSSMPVAIPSAGSGRPPRLPAADKETTEASPQREDKAGAAAWTIQQALAAVAAIAAPPAATSARGAAAPASKLPLQDLSGEALAPPISVGAGVQRGQLVPAAMTFEREAGDESAAPKSNAQLGSSSIALQLDARGFGAALEHARPVSISQQTLPASIADQGMSNVDVDLHQLDALVRDIAAVSGASGRAAFRLTAEQLGPIEVRLHSSEAGVAVTIRTHDDQSHTTVAQAQQQLTDDMRANGLKVAATNVMLGGGADRQRQDRPQGPAMLPIEIAVPEAEQSQTPNEPRPDGRYA